MNETWGNVCLAGYHNPVFFFFFFNNKSPPLDFPDSPVVKTLPFNKRGAGLISGRGAKIPQDTTKKPKHKTQAILEQIQ